MTNRAVWPKANTSPAPGRDDHEMTLDEMHTELVDAGNRARVAEERIGKMETRHLRLLHTCRRVLNGTATLMELQRVVGEVGK